MTSKKGSHLYGFEDYKVLRLSDSHLFGSYNAILPYSTDNSSVTFLTVDNSLPVKVTYDWHGKVKFSPCLYENHPELLNTAKKVYVHQHCKLSRSMMAEKYGKCLNHWLSDAVVVPEPSDNECRLYDTAIFANDDAKLIVIVSLDDVLNIAQAHIFGIGKKFEELCKFVPDYYGSATRGYNRQDVLDSEFFFAGKCLTIPNNQSYILDVLTNQIPTSKTVFEESVQESLSTESNQLDLDALVNIKDMLNSSDAETVGAGLKALSMMDYMHYPNSIRYIIKSLVNTQYRYNKAANSTSVKFMFKQLCESPKRNRWPGDYDHEIYEQDFELYKQLINYYEPTHRDNISNRLKYMEFMTADANNIPIPRLKQ